MVAPYRPDEAAYQFSCDSAGKYNIRAYLRTAWLSPFVVPLGNLEVGDRYLGYLSTLTTPEKKKLIFYMFFFHVKLKIPESLKILKKLKFEKLC